MAGVVTTVLGAVSADQLGWVDYHDHVFQVSPLLPGDEIDSEPASLQEILALRDSGFGTMMDATPIGLGRKPAAVARISKAAGLHVVAATGFHREAHYRRDDPLRELSIEQRAALFVRELTQGQLGDDEELRRGAPLDQVATATTPRGQPVRAAFMKTGIDYWRISTFERDSLQAAAIAHEHTGAPIMVHLEFCTAAHELLDLLEGLGVAANRIILAHADRDPDKGLHLELAARGAFLGYDGMARPKGVSEAVLLQLTHDVVAGGGGSQVLLGADVARGTRYIAYGGMPGLAYLGKRYVPRLAQYLDATQLDAILVRNPARVLTATNNQA